MMVMLMAIAMGAVTGLLSGIMGVGGGVILVPMLAVLLNVPQHLAQGISMIVIIPTALAGLFHFYKKKLINYRVAGYLTTGAIIGTLVSSNLVQYIPSSDLKRIFGIFVMYTGTRMLLAKKK